MQVKKPASSVDALFGPPAPEVEYVAPPKVGEELIQKADEALKMKNPPLRLRCLACGAYEGTKEWTGLACRVQSAMSY